MTGITITGYIARVSKSKKTLAMKNCANWKSGMCSGVVYEHKDNKTTVTVDAVLANKPCIVDDGCYYFEKYVAPSIVAQGMQ